MSTAKTTEIPSGLSDLANLRIILVLLVLVVASAFAVVTVRHQNRVAFYEIEKLQQQRDQFAIEWRQFQAELATWRLEHNIELEAKATRKMQAPELLAIETVWLGKDQMGPAQ